MEGFLQLAFAHETVGSLVNVSVGENFECDFPSRIAKLGAGKKRWL